MKTKLVYVLTCAPEKTYIEQALMSVYSARHWNPDAHIVLITDNLTDSLLTGARGEILNYISEKIVVPFPEVDNMHYRSRQLKTSVRNLLDGDFLFIDCDTIISQSLDEVDRFNTEVGAVLDEHLPLCKYAVGLDKANNEKAKLIGFDYHSEASYFNSGVMFVKDCEEARQLYHVWNRELIISFARGVFVDQPALGKANALCNHIISPLPDVWNTIVFMRPRWIHESKIIHFWNYRNVSIMYTTRFLQYVKEKGLDDYVKFMVLSPVESMPPFVTLLFTASAKDKYYMFKKVISIWKKTDKSIGDLYKFIPWPMMKVEVKLLRKRFYFLAATLYFLRKSRSVKKHPIYDDICWGR